jgi:uncharacterized membrane protein
MVIAHIFTSEKMNRRKTLAFFIGLAAMILMIRPWDIQDGNTIKGIVSMIVAAITFAAYTVMGRQSIERVGTFCQTCLGFFMGCAVLLVEILVMRRPLLDGVSENILVVLYVGIFVTGLGYAFYFLAIRYSDASTGSIAFFIKPAIAPVLAVLILGESVYWNTIIGIAMLITASFITLGKKEKEVVPLQAKVVAQSGNTVKLRQKPSTSCNMYWDIPVGTEVMVTDYGPEWPKVVAGGLTGYMMTEFLEIECEVVPGEEPVEPDPIDGDPDTEPDDPDQMVTLKVSVEAAAAAYQFLKQITEQIEKQVGRG